MTKQNDKKTKSKGGAKEVIRKILVSIKKNPQALPLLALTVSFLVYSLNLTVISNTTAKVYGAHMGICSFVTMLFSMLSYVCMFSAYPKRKKPNIALIILMLVMYAAILFVDNYYRGRIWAAVTRPEELSPIKITEATMYILDAYNMLKIHMITVVVTMVCVVAEPFYAKLLKKINTSVEVEDNGELGAIELSDED
ncbi:MAG: hypothetical protein IJ282_02095 [Lachnospiraceae bacterium]|nr:hypothetical protein [Lachnospiraceae bacterium]